MNKHSKMALIVAPFLLIGGYGLMDLYLTETQDPRYFQLQLTNADCNISANECILTAGELELSIYLEDDMTVVNTTFPMYRVSLFTVASDGSTEEVKLGMVKSPYYWRAEMSLARKLAENPNGLTMRVIAQHEQDSYMSEFSAR